MDVTSSALMSLNCSDQYNLVVLKILKEAKVLSQADHIKPLKIFLLSVRQNTQK